MRLTSPCSGPPQTAPAELKCLGFTTHAAFNLDQPPIPPTGELSVSKHVSIKVLRTLCGRRSGRVELSEGPAIIDGDSVSITLKPPGGHRIYDLAASALFD
jgi:hypothetical protein